MLSLSQKVKIYATEFQYKDRTTNFQKDLSFVHKENTSKEEKRKYFLTIDVQNLLKLRSSLYMRRK